MVDDGSLDNTPESISRFKDDPRFRYVRTDNQGQPKAKNRGLAESRGEFIGFCDADDLWHREKLKVQMPIFQNLKVGVSYTEVSYIDQFGTEINKPQPYSRYSGNVTNQLAIKNFIPFGTALFRRACVEQNGSFDEDLPMGIDWDLWLRYSLDWEFKYIPEKTYIYRLWPGQMSKNYRGRYDNASRILTKFLKQYPNILPESVISRAWADMHVSRAMAIANAEKTFREPFKDILAGLRKDYAYWPAWRSLAKLVVRKF
ncbi:glycosyl transferase family 2 [Marinobacter pelagius]|uniref:Glycosyl transferase family 2 n=1 Tax=Marinobacter pelagius TaxID=379482 RepID=A0A366GHA1_9GAMM|nr:glycosyl transferase family 2 [Marinobacter pelagius]